MLFQLKILVFTILEIRKQFWRNVHFFTVFISKQSFILVTTGIKLNIVQFVVQSIFLELDEYTGWFDIFMSDLAHRKVNQSGKHTVHQIDQFELVKQLVLLAVLNDLIFQCFFKIFRDHDDFIESTASIFDELLFDFVCLENSRDINILSILG